MFLLIFACFVLSRRGNVLSQLQPVILRCEAYLLTEYADEVGGVCKAHLACNDVDAVVGCHQQSLGAMYLGAQDVLQGRGAQFLAEEAFQMRLSDAGDICQCLYLRFLVDVLLDVGNHLQQSFVYFLYLLRLCHKERGYNPHKPLQLHLLRTVHLGIAYGVFAIGGVCVEILGTGVGKGQLRVVVAVVFEEQVYGLLASTS